MAQKILIGKVTSDGEPVSDVAVKIKDRPCYISGRDGMRTIDVTALEL